MSSSGSVKPLVDVVACPYSLISSLRTLVAFRDEMRISPNLRVVPIPPTFHFSRPQDADLERGEVGACSSTPYSGDSVDQDIHLDSEDDPSWYLTFLPTDDPSFLSGRVKATAQQVRDQVHIQITYHRITEALRAMGKILILADTAEEQSIDSLTFEEEAQFDSMGVLVDCSRNAVFLPKQVEELLRTCALIGINVLQLYTEDTYKIPGEPFFGYNRGGYTEEELSRIHQYASRFSIEVVPCIQTLGHLGQILQWPRYSTLRDTSEVLLAHSDETYAFIDKMIQAATAGGKCRRIHLGMDESIGVGEGRHRMIFGEINPQDIFLHHISKVNELCAKRQLDTMIWSDMLFVLAGDKRTPHYVDEVRAPSDVEPRDLPSTTSLVYWDYYHTTPDAYIRRIQEHRRLSGRNPIVATGVWTWNRLWAQLHFSMAAINACIRACKLEGVKEVIVTIWGDDAGECDIWSAIPALHAFADLGYHNDTSKETLAKSFGVLNKGSLDDWMMASEMDNPLRSPYPPNLTTPQSPSNFSKWLLWEDPMVSPAAKQYASMGSDLPHFYVRLSSFLEAAMSTERCEDLFPLNTRLCLPLALCRVLSLKAGLAERAREHYFSGDTRAMRGLLHSQVTPLIEAVENLWIVHREMWMDTYRAFGWEVLEIRYGGLRARLATMSWRIERWITAIEESSKSPEEVAHLLEELSQEPQLIHGEAARDELLSFDYARVATSSRALGSG